MAPQKVLLVGYGSVGFVLTYTFENTGKAEVTVVARSNYEQAVKGEFAFRSKKFGDIDGFKPTRVLNSVSQAADQEYDYVIVTTKAIPELQTTAELLEPLLSKTYPHRQPAYVLIQNGLGVEKDLWEAILQRGDQKPAAVVTCSIRVMAMMDNGVVVHGPYARLSAGFYPPGYAHDQAILDDFKSLSEAGGAETALVDNIQSIKFQKNVWNASYSTVACLSRQRPGVFWSSEMLSAKTSPVLDAILNEIFAIGRAMGVGDKYFMPQSEARDFFNGIGGSHKPSTLLDIERGKPFELEVILGELVREGQRLGVLIPRLEAIYMILSIAQDQALQAWRQSH